MKKKKKKKSINIQIKKLGPLEYLQTMHFVFTAHVSKAYRMMQRKISGQKKIGSEGTKKQVYGLWKPCREQRFGCQNCETFSPM